MPRALLTALYQKALSGSEAALTDLYHEAQRLAALRTKLSARARRAEMLARHLARYVVARRKPPSRLVDSCLGAEKVDSERVRLESGFVRKGKLPGEGVA